MGRRLHLELRADASLARKLRTELKVWLGEAGINGAVGSEITTAVNEAFVNAVEHPFEHATDQIDVLAELNVSEVVVRDDGTWNDELDPGRQHFGLGVIIASMDPVAIERGASGTVVTLRKTR